MKGILFKEDLFKLTVERIKTQTRRTIKVPADYTLINYNDITGYTTFHYSIMDGKAGMIHGMYPRYKKDETVYLKEPYIEHCQYGIFYKYDIKEPDVDHGCCNPKLIWQNKMFMPEKYARHFIKITNVRIQRLNEISMNDANAEGFDWKPGIKWCQYPELGITDAYRSMFLEKWSEINGKESWSANPYVWVYDYQLTEK